MVTVEIALEKSVDENAGKYFDKAKKLKAKIEGIEKTIKIQQEKLAKLKNQEESFYEQEAQRAKKNARKQEWYEKFHWFISSEEFLCVGGRDATSNELIIKKHTEANDIVLHTDMAGSPFFVIKNGQVAGEATLKEAAQAVAAHSRAWKLGHATADVFYVKPEQVTKEAKSGETVAKGSFMVYGKTTYLRPQLEYAFALIDEEVVAGPVGAVLSKAEDPIIVVPGKEKKSALAKTLRKLLKGGDVDDYVKFLPSGGAEIVKKKKKK